MEHQHANPVLEAATRSTLAHYDATADAYDAATTSLAMDEHYAAFLRPFAAGRRLRILDLGCGPGRDVEWFKRAGHDVVGLDGSPRCCSLARRRTGCSILRQSFLQLRLPDAAFDGVFAFAAFLHVPPPALPRVFGQVAAALRPRGVLLAGNPLGGDEQGFSGERYICLHSRRALDGYAASTALVLHHRYSAPPYPVAGPDFEVSVWRKPHRSQGTRT